MEVSLSGRIRNTQLPISKSLLPLFEAIINSIDAIEELSEQNTGCDGYIDVFIRRDSRQTRIDSGDLELDPITSFDIEDNGIGFNSKNFTSFEVSDSTYKEAKGGKGVGRLLWLKAFESVAIESTFEEDGQSKQRNFEFDINSLGIHSSTIRVVDRICCKTIVSLKNYLPVYAEKVPRRTSTIAARILEHCLIYFIQSKCPRITLFDNNETFELNQIYKETIGTDSSTHDFDVKGHSFNVTYAFIDSSDDSTQRVHFCANHREVSSEPLSKYIPILSKRVPNQDGKEKIIVAYVSGDWLDNKVNSERTGFYFNVDGGFEYADGISHSDLDRAFADQLKKDFSTSIEELKCTKIQKIQSYVSNYAPQYRHVMKHEELLDVIEVGLSNDKLDMELYKASQVIDRRVREKANRVLETQIDSIEDVYKFEEEYHALVEEINDSGKSKLAQYILQRRLILELLAKHMTATDGKYQKEDVIHKTIFPMRTESDDIEYDKQNLWIVDEKLSYHKYLASDLQFKKMTAVDVSTEAEKQRPDILIFNGPIAVVDESYPYTSVVIVEFKRPMRKDYDDEDNPIEQVYDYVEKIRKGQAVTKDGSHMSVPQGLPFYCYVLADLTPKLRKYANNYSLTEAPENDGYFGYNPNHRAYIEVISYQKLLADAKKRNQILFDKLNVPFK